MTTQVHCLVHHTHGESAVATGHLAQHTVTTSVHCFVCTRAAVLTSSNCGVIASLLGLVLLHQQNEISPHVYVLLSVRQASVTADGEHVITATRLRLDVEAAVDSGGGRASSAELAVNTNRHALPNFCVHTYMPETRHPPSFENHERQPHVDCCKFVVYLTVD